MLNNIISGNLVNYDGLYFYYSNISTDEGKLYRKSVDFKMTEKLSDVNDVSSINIKGNHIYYLSQDNIYSLNLETRENKIIFSKKDTTISNMFIIGEDVFFNTDDINSTQYVLNLENLDINKLYTDAYGLIIKDKKIYYSGNENFGIHTFDLDTGQITKIIESNVLYPVTDFKYIYYFDFEEKGFCKVKMNNDPYLEKPSKLQGFNSEDVKSYNIMNDNILFATDKLYKYNLSTQETHVILDLYATKIHVVNNEIWFKSYVDDTFKLYKTDLNGTNLILVK